MHVTTENSKIEGEGLSSGIVAVIATLSCVAAVGIIGTVVFLLVRAFKRRGMYYQTMF